LANLAVFSKKPLNYVPVKINIFRAPPKLNSRHIFVRNRQINIFLHSILLLITDDM